ncbi:MarR family winged helix-turn-helix transcriptional regulator [Gillisia sp. Hel_I_29]|uniref:MarR family winged helix-turn-helix transcriptional regulator n=1 Tax=Gillisia sp. Hel_I_29 TaxID=1249975 RepID=UPI00054EBF50|nr:MarR family transcriptional regulator [Gillisia sp. Hel_I_29]
MKQEDINTLKNSPAARRVILSLLMTANQLNEEVAETLKPFGLSIPQFNVLRILRGQKGKPANLSTIQNKMVSKMSNTTRLVDKLITKGLVERITCKKNRRKVEITITDRGLALLAEIDPVVVISEETSTDNLSASEIETLTILLEKLRK